MQNMWLCLMLFQPWGHSLTAGTTTDKCWHLEREHYVPTHILYSPYCTDTCLSYLTLSNICIVVNSLGGDEFVILCVCVKQIISESLPLNWMHHLCYFQIIKNGGGCWGLNWNKNICFYFYSVLYSILLAGLSLSSTL